MSGLDEAPHLARRLLTRAGTSVRSTLDAPLQRFAAETLRNRLASLSERNVEDGAVIVIDNATGDVLAYVGSSGDLSGAAAVDGAAALRQPGSTLKPFLYGVAIEQRWLTAASLLDDAPLALTTPSGLYVPQNYERDFKGAVSVRSALAASLNVPAVRTLQLVGLERFRQTLQAFGMSSVKHDGEYYGYGLALGGGDTSLLALTNAYRALANAGVWSPAHLQIERGSGDGGDAVRVLSAEASFIVSDILADAAARAATFGLASPLSTRSWAAVKTGTSKGMRDNWAIGYTDRYTVGCVGRKFFRGCRCGTCRASPARRRSGARSSIICMLVSRAVRRVFRPASCSATLSSHPQWNRHAASGSLRALSRMAGRPQASRQLRCPQQRLHHASLRLQTGPLLHPTPIFQRHVNQCWCGPMHRKQRVCV